MDCHTNLWLKKNWPSSMTMSMGAASLPACNSALSLCMDTQDILLHVVVVLSVIVGILLTFSMVLLFFLYFRLQRCEKDPTPVKKDTATAEPVLARPKQSRSFNTGHIMKPRRMTIKRVLKRTRQNGEVTALPSPRSLSQSKPQLGLVGGAIEENTLIKVSSVALVHAFSDDNQPDRLCDEPVTDPGTLETGEEKGEMRRKEQTGEEGEEGEGGRAPVSGDRTDPPCTQQHPSPVPPLAAVAVDDFNQGQDEEFHPEVRALVEGGHFTKEVIRRLKPIPPKAGTVIPDYNPVLDEARPETIDEYLHNYRIFFVIDDSRSMVRHWKETCKALSDISDYALTYHSDAVDIRFFNSRYRKSGVRGTNQVMDIFHSVSTSAGTPTGRVLGEVLNEQLDRLDQAQRDGTYSSERPLDIIVLTDGVPNRDSPPAPVIEAAARRLKATRHHQNWVGIQFVQIGDDPYAAPTLLSLIDCENNDMVDTISYSFYKDEAGGKLTSQILERIILGGLHPNLRSYFNQYRRKLNEKTSEVIY